MKRCFLLLTVALLLVAVPLAVAELDWARELKRLDRLQGPAAEAEALALVRRDPAGAPMLVQHLRDQDAAVRRCACHVLGKMGPLAGTALPDLAAAGRDPEQPVKLAALEALGRLARWYPSAVTEHLVGLAPGAAWREQEAICLALRSCGAASHRAQKTLVQWLDVTEGRVAAYAAQALSGSVSAEAIPGLVMTLERGPTAQGAAVSALVNIGEAALPDLGAGLRSDQPERRRGCALAARRILAGGVGAPLSLVADLGAALLDPDPVVQTAAARGLAFCVPLPAPVLEALLAVADQPDQEPELLAAVAGSLEAASGDSERIDEALTALCRHEVPLVASEAVACLARRTASSEGFPSVLRNALSHPSPQVRLAAAGAAMNHGRTQAAAPVLQELMESAAQGTGFRRAEVIHDGEDWLLRPVRAVELLAALGGPGLTVLEGAMSSNREEVRLLGAFGFERLGPQARPLLEQWLTGSGLERKLLAPRLLVRLEPEPEVVSLLGTALQDRNPTVREAACRALVPWPEGLTLNLSPLLEDRSIPVRLAATRAIRARGTATQAEQAGLTALAGRRPAELRGEAIWTLVECGVTTTDSLRAALEEAQAKGNSELSSAAWAGLGALENRPGEALAALSGRLTDGNPRRREAAIRSMGYLGSAAREREIDLIRALWDQETGVRAAAAEALGRIRSLNSLTTLCLASALAEDEESQVRIAAARALAHLTRPPEVVLVLQDVLWSDPSPEVRTELRRTLGEDAGGPGLEDRDRQDVIAALQWVDPQTRPLSEVLEILLQLRSARE